MTQHAHALTSAGLCRARYWTPGTLLTDLDDPAAPTIRVTAIGETVVLARRISHHGHPCQDVETIWNLREHAWQPSPGLPCTS